MQAEVSRPVRFGVLAVIAVLAAGLVWLGVVRYQAERRTASLAAGAGDQEAPRDADPTRSQADPAAPAVPASPAAQSVEQPKPQLIVHVTGAVVRPGVYRLEPGMRVADAITAAGGALPEAMADSLNLAAHLADGDKIYVPTVKETATPAPVPVPAARGATQGPVTSVSQSSGSNSTPKAPSGPVNVNTATVQELDRVNGIGPTTANAIVAYRTRNGPFKRLEDIQKVQGIGPKTFEKLRPYLTL